VSLFVAPCGCVELPPERLPDPPSEELRSQFGRIAVTWSASGDQLGGILPAGGSLDGAGRGAVAGMAVDLKVMGDLVAGEYPRMNRGHALFIATVFGIGMLPVSALIGTVYGSVSALEAPAVENAVRSIQGAIARREFSRDVAESILWYARADGADTLVELLPGTRFEGVDTVLEVEPTMLFFQGEVRLNPPVCLRVRQSATLWRVSDRTVLYRITLIHASSRKAEFQVWSDDDAALLLSELEGVDRELGQRLVEHLFARHATPAQR
jgi:hypothetical protein